MWGREGLDGRPRPVPFADMQGACDHTPTAPGDHKGPPHHSSPPSPLRNLMGFSLG